jgi:hypothetical protein
MFSQESFSETNRLMAGSKLLMSEFEDASSPLTPNLAKANPLQHGHEPKIATVEIF